MQLLTTEEAAKKLKLKPEAVRDRIKDGRIRAFKDGRVWRIREEDLEAYVNALPCNRKVRKPRRERLTKKEREFLDDFFSRGKKRK